MKDLLKWVKEARKSRINNFLTKINGETAEE